MQRNGIFAPGEHYHLLGRGNYKQETFHDWDDYARFLFLILYFQFQGPLHNITDLARSFAEHLRNPANRAPNPLAIVGNRTRLIKLVGFTLMANHYHLAVEELEEGGISKYMQRILNSITKYHNTRYEKAGHLFQGAFKAVHQETNEQVLHLSAYIHRNPRELPEWRDREILYPWSSYQDYVGNNRWGDLLVPNIILDQFDSKQAYKAFVESSPAKETQHPMFD